MMKNKFFILILIFMLMLLSGCGTVTDEGVVFHTANPNFNFGFRFVVPAEASLIPTVTRTVVPEVVPAEEIGETIPDPAPVPPCELVKGNISRSGEKIYHVEGGAYFDQVKIDENSGEKFFCSEVEAISAGWRKAQR